MKALQRTSGCATRCSLSRAASTPIHQTVSLRGRQRSAAKVGKRRVVVQSATEQQPPAAPLPRDDDVLPDNLADSLFQASQAAVLAMERGATRCIVELLIPEFWDPMSGPVFSDEGDQMRFWKLVKTFLDNLREQQPSKQLKALFPDMGVTVMIKNQWKEPGFEIGCINSRAAVSEGDEIVIMAAPDPQGSEDCRKVVDELPDDTPVVLFNPRLARSAPRCTSVETLVDCSGDVGVGLNVRRIRDMFLSTFVTVYSLRPIGDIGSVFRKFPEPWMVFIEDENSPGRYRRIAERSTRPAGQTSSHTSLLATWAVTGDALDAILQEAQGISEEGNKEATTGLAESFQLPLRSLQRFMKSLM